MKSRGLTLTELLVALAVLGIVLAAATPSLASLMNRRRVQAVADQLVADLAYARTETALRSQRVVFRVNSNVSPSCYSIYYQPVGGATCNCSRGAGKACTDLQGYPAPGFELRTYVVPDGIGVGMQAVAPADIIYFNAPQMTATPGDAQIKVVGSSGAQLMVKLNPVGHVSLCSPDASMSGVPPC